MIFIINTFNLTEINTNIDSIIKNIVLNNNEVYINNDGQNIAVILPFHKYQSKFIKNKNQGLLKAKGALSYLGDKKIDSIVNDIYLARKNEKVRKINIV